MSFDEAILVHVLYPVIFINNVPFHSLKCASLNFLKLIDEIEIEIGRDRDRDRDW